MDSPAFLPSTEVGVLEERLLPSISVIVPALNAVATLSETLRTVAAQTWADWELIVVDDGSTDSTRLTAQAWCNRDTRIRLISGANVGLAGARNAGARLATAPWLLFLDADDLIHPRHFELMLAATSADPQPDLVFCSGRRMAADGRVDVPEVPFEGGSFERLAAYPSFFVHACIVRRAAFEAFGGFDTALRACEDWDLWQRMSRSGLKFVRVDECLAIYRMRARSMTHSAAANFEIARHVVLRGHAFDARVESPLPEYAAGRPMHEVAERIFSHVLWTIGMVVGADHSPSEFLAKVAPTPIARFDVDIAVLVFIRAVATGACVTTAEWPMLWRKCEAQIARAFHTLQLWCVEKTFSSDCLIAMEKRANSS